MLRVINDSTSCIYPQANSLDYCDNLSHPIFNKWMDYNCGSEPGCVVQLTTANAIADTVSIEMTGQIPILDGRGVTMAQR